MISNQSAQNTITLGGIEVPYVFCTLPQMQLQFYPDNPRIYSIVYTGDHTLSQVEIEDKLLDREHVRELAQSIKANQGLTDPLWVRDGDYLVIEGNSRLAAYRLLSRGDPVKWGMVKCHLLPSELDDEKIFSFLCLTHVVGRQDWAPYEQAGIIWRRWKQHGATPQRLAKEMGLSESRIEHLIKVYSFMDKHDDKEVLRWSFYDEYLKSRKIDKRRDEFPDLDSIVVQKIKSGEIPKAEDVRDQLTKIAGAPGRAFQWFLSGQRSLQECYDRMVEKGDANALRNSLYKFRVRIGDLATKRALENMDEHIQRKCRYELKRIKKSVDKLLKAI